MRLLRLALGDRLCGGARRCAAAVRTPLCMLHTPPVPARHPRVLVVEEQARFHGHIQVLRGCVCLLGLCRHDDGGKGGEAQLVRHGIARGKKTIKRHHNVGLSSTRVGMSPTL